MNGLAKDMAEIKMNYTALVSPSIDPYVDMRSDPASATRTRQWNPRKETLTPQDSNRNPRPRSDQYKDLEEKERMESEVIGTSKGSRFRRGNYLRRGFPRSDEGDEEMTWSWTTRRKGTRVWGRSVPFSWRVYLGANVGQTWLQACSSAPVNGSGGW